MTATTGVATSLSAEGLTETQRQLRELARDFTREQVLPVANELDPIGEDIPMSLRDQMAELGFFGVLIPEEHGGLGLGVMEYALLTEELARGWMSVASLIARGQQFTAGLNEEQRDRLLPLMARGKYLSAYALSEAEAGSDVANMTCRATQAADGSWLISGQKMWCTFADGADYLQVFARTEPRDPAHRARGITCFMLPKARGIFPDGVTGSPVRKIGYHGWKTWELAFDGARAEPDAIVGERGHGFAVAMGDLELARIHTAARALGLARGALEDAIEYAGVRVQFGQPIGANQAIRFKIAHMAAEIESVRALLHRTCRAYDGGVRDPKTASMLKYLASEMAERVTSESLQIHGGAGYTTDFPVERYWRDARLTKIFEGTSEIQLKIISDSLLGRQ